VLASAITAAVLVVGGIGYRLAQPTHDRTAEVIDGLQQFTEEMCSCKDGACTKHVTAEMVAWSRTFEEASPKPPKLDEVTAKRAADLLGLMTECMSKVASVQPATTR
jgi:hypothetical protein